VGEHAEEAGHDEGVNRRWQPGARFVGFDGVAQAGEMLGQGGLMN